MEDTRRRLLADARRSARWAALALGAALAPDGLTASTRDHVLQWVPPSGTVEGYRVRLGPTPSYYDQIVELGLVPPDTDGLGRATLTLDAARDYFVVMSAYNTAGESAPSNEIVVAASACDPSQCDDADQCTADDCGPLGCTHTSLPDGTFCSAPGSPYGMCIAAVCQPAQCTQQSHCDDGDVCNGVESCSASGGCTTALPLACGAPTQCAVPSCDPVRGCVSTPRTNGTPCDDGKRATINDACQQGVCVGQRARGKKP